MKKLKMSFFAVVTALVLCFASCTESSKRTIKDFSSDWNGGLERTAVLYDYNGDTIKTWSGKFDIRDSGNDNQIFFDLNGKRVWIQGGIFIAEEK